MSDVSSNLSLPFIQPSQAQKHVTHNEGVLRLDALVQLSVLAMEQTTPPAAPQSGDRYIVPLSPVGAWAGHEGTLAIYQENVWMFYTPKTGWVAWVDTLGEQRVFDGSDWIEMPTPIEFQNMDHMGINTTADITNRLSVSSAATLFTHDGAGHQLKINKATTSDTASLLFQTGWSGKAEMGTAGNNNFSINTSDGGTWITSLDCSSTNGRVSLPAGLSGRVEQFDLGGSAFFGENAGLSDDLSNNCNTFFGTDAGRYNTSGEWSIAVGYAALRDNTTGSNNSALGYSALRSNTTGANNTVAGYAALYFNITGSNNTAIGRDALRFTTSGADNETYSNCSGLGFNTRVSGSNQIQLGNSSTTTYAYGAVQDRSDARDKTDVRDTGLGLEFITQLRPVDFRWDLRDDYLDQVEVGDEATDDIPSTKFVRHKKDGSRKRSRYHHGLIAQEVEQIIKDSGVDFGGFQDHSRSDGDDVLSLGYSELICPLIKAVQELSERINVLENK